MGRMTGVKLHRTHLTATTALLAAVALCWAGMGPATAGSRVPDTASSKAPPSTGGSGSAKPGAFVHGQVIVGYRRGTAAKGLGWLPRAAGATKSLALGRRSMLLDVGKGNVRADIATLRHNPAVQYAEPDYILQAAATPDDPSFSQQWGLLNTGQVVNGSKGKRSGADISATQAWDITTDTGDVVIAEADSGIDYNHPDLAGNIWTNPGGIGGCPTDTHGYNVIDSSCYPMDDYKHGTFVAGVMGASGNNGIGISGVAWQTQMLPVKFMNSKGFGTVARLIKALDWIIAAKQAGVNIGVVNESGTWTSWTYSQALDDELAKLADNNILFITAAGNSRKDNDTTPRYPCNYDAPNEICVAAINQWDKIPSWSNYGATTVDLAAPGNNIYSTLPGGKYGFWKGTSFSAAYVSGAAAMIASHCPTLSVTQLKSDILDSVDVRSTLAGKVATGGQLDLYQALQACSP